jgi:hypothetical protein
MVEKADKSSTLKGGLRPEARPFTRDVLTNSQSLIYDRIVSLFFDALNQLESSKDRQEIDPLPSRLLQETRRINPVIMVSGARGTGKTSLLLTLQREVLTSQESTNASQPKHRLKDRTIWLETLDLEPLPINTGLMAAIMARLERVIDEDTDKNCLKLSRPTTEFDQIIQSLRDLSLDVCLAWDPTYPRLDCGSDSDLYASELMRIERARTNLQSRFSKLLDDLANCSPWTGGKRNPIFVLPVDDIDLNPTRCLELLRLVGSMRSPRLVILLIGDFEVARQVVNISYLKELGDLLPDHSAPSDGIRKSVDDMAFRLGAEAIRKRLPPHQRLRIENISISEAMNFPKDGSIANIGDLLDKLSTEFRFEMDGSPLTVKEFLRNDTRWPEGFTYSGAKVLTTSLRRLADLTIRLEEISYNTNEGKRLREFVDLIATEADNGLELDGVDNSIVLHSEDRLAKADVLASNPFRLDYGSSQGISTSLSYPRASNALIKSPVLPRLFWVSGNMQDTNLSTVAVSDQTLGGLVLLHDLRHLSKTPKYSSMRVPSLESLDLFRVDWQLESNTEKCSVTWPAPKLETVWELDMFLAYWNQFCNRQSVAGIVSTEDIAPFATFWLALCGAIAFKSKKLWDLVRVGDQDNDQFLGSVIEEYAAQVPAIPTERKTRRSTKVDSKSASWPTPSKDSWLIRCVAMLSFESYIDTYIANEFFKNAKLNYCWSQALLGTYVKEYRRQATSNPKSLVAHVMLNPKGYADAVRVVLEDADYIAEQLANDDLMQSQATRLSRSIKSALAAANKEKWLPDAFEKSLRAASADASSIGRAPRLRRVLRDNGEARERLSVLESHIAALLSSLTLWRSAKEHVLNSITISGDFCPELSLDQVLA